MNSATAKFATTALNPIFNRRNKFQQKLVRIHWFRMVPTLVHPRGSYNQGTVSY